MTIATAPQNNPMNGTLPIVIIVMSVSGLVLFRFNHFNEKKMGTRRYNIFTKIFTSTFSLLVFLTVCFSILNTDAFGILGRFLASSIHNQIELVVVIAVILELWLLVPILATFSFSSFLGNQINPISPDSRSLRRFREDYK